MLRRGSGNAATLDLDNRFEKTWGWDSYAPLPPPYQPRLLFGTPGR